MKEKESQTLTTLTVLTGAKPPQPEAVEDDEAAAPPADFVAFVNTAAQITHSRVAQISPLDDFSATMTPDALQPSTLVPGGTAPARSQAKRAPSAPPATRTTRSGLTRRLLAASSGSAVLLMAGNGRRPSGWLACGSPARQNASLLASPGHPSAKLRMRSFSAKLRMCSFSAKLRMCSNPAVLVRAWRGACAGEACAAVDATAAMRSTAAATTAAAAGAAARSLIQRITPSGEGP
jgi:hypothetical protein